jgi:hypothetical protein
VPATGTDRDGCRSSQAQASVAGLIAALAIVLARDRIHASLNRARRETRRCGLRGD